MKFRAHETFFIRKGWLTKGLKAVTQNDEVFIDKEENPMDVLGIGSNMVKSLRYWLQAVGITAEPSSGRRTQTLTELGEAIYAHDRYIEELGTLWLLHYKLATNKEEASSWYYFFNEFNLTEFDREDFISSIQNWIAMETQNDAIAIRSLGDDFACIINTYLPRYKSNPAKVSPESNIDCPLGELGLIDILSRERKTYKKAIPSASTIDPHILMAIIADQNPGRTEIGLNELLTSPCSIGKVMSLDVITMLDALYRAEKIGALKITRTAGMDVVSITCQRSFIEWVKLYYETIE